MQNLYPKILHNLPLQVKEDPQTYLTVRERHIQAIWLEQKAFTQLKTHDGLPITVLSPGIWNAEAGPDFLKAHLIIGNQTIRGDVEIHLEDGGWYQHRHHLDKRYNNVILHLSLWKQKHKREILTQSDKTIPRTYLEHNLNKPIESLIKTIDLDLYPYREFVGSGRCAHELFQSLPKNETESLFKSAALWRLKEKYSLLSQYGETEDEHFKFGVAGALGYRRNSQVFTKIYAQLHRLSSKTINEKMAIAMGLCSLFEEPYLARWSASTYFKELHLLWKKQSSDFVERYHLEMHQCRPYNHPIRRLAALCHLSSDDTPLYSNLSKGFLSGGTPSQLEKKLKTLIPSYSNSYWSYHYSLNSKKIDTPIQLIGPQLKLIILINVFIPLLSQFRSPDLIDFYCYLTSAPSGKQRYLTHRFFGDNPEKKLLKNALHEQGAFQIHKDFCLHFEASCEGCPFVERVNKALIKIAL